MAPNFLFTIDRLRQNPQTPDRVVKGVWLPPRPSGSNQKVSGNGYPLVFSYDQTQTTIIEWPSEPSQGYVRHYATYSVYYDRSNFWGVPYDAATYQVGNGEQTSEELSDDSDSNSDGPSHLEDWSRVEFNHNTPFSATYTSEITLGGEHERLWYQHSDQTLTWVSRLFPDDMHSASQYPVTPETRHYGGIIGSLPLLIALLAFSTTPDNVRRHMRNCIRGGSWEVAQRPRGEGWRPRRGVVVSVYTWTGREEDVPLAQTNLRALEYGTWGKYFC